MTKEIPLDVVKQFHSNLVSNDTYVQALINVQGFTLDTIKQFQLGFEPKSGYIAIPIMQNEVCVAIKLYNSKKNPKYRFYQGGKSLWGVDKLQSNKQVLICAGEKDRMIAIQNGFFAVCSTTGEGSWDDGWNKFFEGKEVVIVYDNDDAGRNGAEKVANKLFKIASVKVLDISLVCKNEAEDLQDYFVRYKKTKSDLDALIQSTPTFQPVNNKNSETSVISRSFSDTGTLTEFFERLSHFKAMVQKHFPTLVTLCDVCLSVLVQLRIEGISNPFALMVVGPPSSSKTTLIDIFNVGEGIAYYTDSFTPASFVSSDASKKEEHLKKIDLLPKLKHKLFLTPEMAPLFSVDSDKLTTIFGNLTRILDGNGIQVNSGSHGQRGYSGDYSFMWIGATTPIRQKIWKILGNMGARIFFYQIPEISYSSEDVLQMVNGEVSYSDRIKECRSACLELLKFLWTVEKIKPEKDCDDEATVLQIANYAKALCHLRATIENDAPSYEKEHPVVSTIETPLRLTTLLLNLARGHAFLNGRPYIDCDDFWVVKEVALNSCPDNRRKIIQGLIDRQGTLTIDLVQRLIERSDKTATRYMRHFKALGLVHYDEGGAMNPSKIVLKDEFRFLLV